MNLNRVHDAGACWASCHKGREPGCTYGEPGCTGNLDVQPTSTYGEPGCTGNLDVQPTSILGNKVVSQIINHLPPTGSKQRSSCQSQHIKQHTNNSIIVIIIHPLDTYPLFNNYDCNKGHGSKLFPKENYTITNKSIFDSRTGLLV